MRLVESSFSKILWLACALIWVGCASDQAKWMEEAQFLLDQGRFAEAEVKARQILAEEPDHVEGTYLLASALFGQSVLGENATFLTFLSRVLEDQGSDTELQTFARVAPALLEENLSKLEEATDILYALPNAAKTEDVYLLLYATRMFEVAAAVTLIGGTSDDVECNFNPGQMAPDGVPDELEPDALDEDQNERFRINLVEAGPDGENAGLPEDFDITTRFNTMLDDLDAAIANAGDDVDQGTADYFSSQFPADGSQGCPTA